MIHLDGEQAYFLTLQIQTADTPNTKQGLPWHGRLELRAELSELDGEIEDDVSLLVLAQEQLGPRHLVHVAGWGGVITRLD